MKCAICQSRKPQRHCPGMSAEICSRCCGAERGRKVTCPEDCRHLAQSREFQGQRDSEKRLQEFERELAAIEGNEDRYADLLGAYERAILDTGYELDSIDDQDVEQAILLVLEEEKAKRGLISRPPLKPSLDQRTIADAVRRVLEKPEEFHAGIDQMTALSCLNRILGSVREQAHPENPHNYLGFIEEYHGGMEEEDEPFEGELSHPGLPFRISYEVDPAEIYGQMDEASEELLGQALVNLYSPDAHENAKALRAGNELRSRYPDHPRVLNFLSSAYGYLEKDVEFEALTKENYEKNPGYPFAVWSMADVHLRQGELDAAAEVLSGRWTLPDWLEGRQVAHVSEFTAFYGLMVTYFILREEPEKAKPYLSLLEELFPNHSATAMARHMAAHAEGECADGCSHHHS